jgi:hypothetical protein
MRTYRSRLLISRENFSRVKASRGIANRAQHPLQEDEGSEDDRDDADEGDGTVKISGALACLHFRLPSTANAPRGEA